MALPLRTLALRQTISATRAQTTTSITRTFSNTPHHHEDKPTYPFSKQPSNPSHVPNPSQQQETPYPFTKPTSPVKISPPTRPTGEPTPSHDTSSSASVQAAHSDLPHQPDYNVAADYRTSAYSPTPMRVMDGSEDTEVTPAAVLSGAPTELQARTVRIFKPAKTATQSGDWHGHHWQMDWDVLGKGHRWENPLMGWQSSGDFMQATHLNFKTKDDAIRFAEKQGYEFYVQEPNERRFLPKAYASQFQHQAKPLKTIRTK